jgi:hypothetical protein
LIVIRPLLLISLLLLRARLRSRDLNLGLLHCVSSILQYYLPDIRAASYEPGPSRALLSTFGSHQPTRSNLSQPEEKKEKERAPACACACHVPAPARTSTSTSQHAPQDVALPHQPAPSPLTYVVPHGPQYLTAPARGRFQVQ